MTIVQEIINWTIKNAFNVEDQDGTKYIVIDHEEMRLHFDNWLEKEKKQIQKSKTKKQILTIQYLFLGFQKFGYIQKMK